MLVCLSPVESCAALFRVKLVLRLRDAQRVVRRSNGRDPFDPLSVHGLARRAFELGLI